MRHSFLALIALIAAPLALPAYEPKAPDTVTALWADFDPRKDALDAKLVREWEKDGNVAYALKNAEPVPFAKPTETYALSSVLHTRTPKELQTAGVKATDKPTPLIDDFAHGWRDWYTLSADNPHHWEFSTRKLSDPTWQGKPGQRLTFEVTAEKQNELVVILTENVFRPYRGKQRQATAVVKLTGGKEPQTVSLKLTDFDDGPVSWQTVDLLSLRAYAEADGKVLGSKTWTGSQPRFYNLRWEGGDR